jgi:L-fucose mutarotase/ribose pyranase (RbsD/FucU family)
MLRGINPLLNPDVLHALAAMVHGDTLAIVQTTESRIYANLILSKGVITE